MKDLVIFGCGDIGELADYYFREDAGRRVAGFTVDRDYCEGDEFRGRPLVAFEDLEDKFPPSEFELFVALAYTDLNKLRRARVDAAAARGYGVASYVSSRASVLGVSLEEENQFILEDNTIQPFARIGRNVTLWSGNHVGHHCTIAEDCFVASHVVISGGVSIGPRSFIGVNATIRDHVTIGADCVIGAGALVLQDLPDQSVVAPRGTEISRVPSSRLKRI